MRTVLLSLCVLTTLPLLAPGVARADEEQAKRHFLEGKQAYQEGRYDAAITSFRAAAAIRPSPILDFNLGRCLEKLGNPEEAIAAYEKYLQGAKDAANRAELKARIAKLREELRRRRAKDPYEALEKGGSGGAGGAVRGPATPAAPAAGAPPATGAPPAAGPSAASRPAAAPSKPAARAEAEPAHEASLPRSWAGEPAAATPARRAPLGPSPATPRDGKPYYKTWWFWVACGAGAALTALFVTTVVYASGGGSSNGRQSALEIRF